MATNGNIKKRPITRNRETLTCAPCRARKLKCDKALPCGSCVKRDEPDSCSYAKSQGRKEIAENRRTSRAEARLQHLEEVVQELVHHSQSGPSVDSSHESHPSELESGSSFTNGKGTYNGATHYSAMLEDIEDLRQVLVEEVDHESSPSVNEAIAAESDVLFGGTPRLPLADILAQHLPPKQEVNRRIAAYFRAEGIAAPFIHIPQFMRQYEQFWTDPTGSPPLWISMMFSICELSQSTGRGAELVPSSSQSDGSNGHDGKPDFSLAAAHCLALGRYSRPQRFAVESLGLYIQARVVSSLDPSRDIGILFGTLVQVAYCMGYHRDPDNFKHLSAFEGEMRRRAWSYCMQLDLLISFQLGLPNNVQFSSWDTRIPSNLKDSDFDEDMLTLPPPRPAGEPTKVTFYTAKHMLMTIFDKILKHALATRGPWPESELLALDAELHTTYETIPLVFHYKSIDCSLADPHYLVVTRKCVELMFQKCMCVLHRKHVAQGRAESIQKCYTASTALVSAFLDLYPELKPGGQFHGDRWLLGSITWNDFLLGLMVLCLILCQQRQSTTPTLTLQDQQALLRMLRSSLEVCLENVDESLGARRTSRLLQKLLEKVQEPPKTQPQPQPSRNSPPFPLEVASFPAYHMGNAVAAAAPAAAAGSAPSSETLTEHEFFSSEALNHHAGMDAGDAIMQGWNDPWANVFDTQEWEFLGQCLNSNFDAQ